MNTQTLQTVAYALASFGTAAVTFWGFLNREPIRRWLVDRVTLIRQIVALQADLTAARSDIVAARERASEAQRLAQIRVELRTELTAELTDFRERLAMIDHRHSVAVLYVRALLDHIRVLERGYTEHAFPLPEECPAIPDELHEEATL